MREKLIAALNAHVPAEAVDYCIQLWDEKSFSFTLSRTRSSCYGNHSFRADRGHLITVNHELKPHAFLLTYVHEVAHLRTFEDNKQRFLQKLMRRSTKIDPHGEEWKRSFQLLMQPILNENFFPAPILKPLQEYMANPKASSVSYHPLAKVLHLEQEGGVFLSDIIDNQLFTFRGVTFKRIEKRRTRILCEDVNTKKRFLIAAIARVEPASEAPILSEVALNLVKLKTIEAGQRFVFNGEVFKKIEARRTRILCESEKNKKLFTIPAEAPVEIID